MLNLISEGNTGWTTRSYFSFLRLSKATWKALMFWVTLCLPFMPLMGVYISAKSSEFSRTCQREKVTPFDSAIPPLRSYPPDYLHMCTEKHVQGCAVYHGPPQPKEHGCCASVCPVVQVSSRLQLILIGEKSKWCRPLLFVWFHLRKTEEKTTHVWHV